MSKTYTDGYKKARVDSKANAFETFKFQILTAANEVLGEAVIPENTWLDAEPVEGVITAVMAIPLSVTITPDDGVIAKYRAFISETDYEEGMVGTDPDALDPDGNPLYDLVLPELDAEEGDYVYINNWQIRWPVGV